MRILESGGRFSTQIERIQHCVPFKYLRRKRLCVHLILAAPHAYFCASSMVEEQEIFPRMSKCYNTIDLQRCNYILFNSTE